MITKLNPIMETMIKNILKYIILLKISGTFFEFARSFTKQNYL